MTSTATPDAVRLLEAHAREQSIPLNVLLELTHRCNLRCRHCYVDTDREPELTTLEVEELLLQLANAGTLILTLTGGEIMLRPDLVRIINAARQLKFAVRLLTNGTLIDEAAADAIAATHPVDVGISVYGARAETHEFITRIDGSFDTATRAIRLLADRDVSVRLKCVLMRQNMAEYQDIIELARELGATVQFDPHVSPRNDGDTDPLRFRLDHDDLIRVIGEEGPQTAPGAEDSIMCSAGRDMSSISPSGTIYPCLQLPIPLGSLREQSFQEVWRNSPAAAALRDFRLNQTDKCADCSDLPYCRPCLGLNHVEAGDVRRPAPSSCNAASARKESDANAFELREA